MSIYFEDTFLDIENGHNRTCLLISIFAIVKFILFIISFCCCVAGALKQTALPVVCFASTTITMPEQHHSTDNNDLSPSSAFCTSPAQFNFFAGLIPNNIQNTIRDYCYAVIFEPEALLSNIRFNAYLLHIHPSHSIW